jgi:platelet-activating factor acetylhydrolase IB subunit alpha
VRPSLWSEVRDGFDPKKHHLISHQLFFFSSSSSPSSSSSSSSSLFLRSSIFGVLLFGGMSLTSRQQELLNLSILSHLIDSGLSRTAQAFEEETGLFALDAQEQSGILPKKWVSVARLQKKTFDLEAQVRKLEDELRDGRSGEWRDEGDSTAQSVLGKRGGGLGRSSRPFLPAYPEKHTLHGHRLPVSCVCFHPDFSLLATSSQDASIKLWDYESGEFERSLKGHTDAVQFIAPSDSGRLLASCSADLTVKIWDFQSLFTCVKTLRGHQHNVSCCCFVHGNEGKVISCSRDGSIRLWELERGVCVKILKGHEGWVRFVDTSQDGRFAVSCGDDRTVRVWELATGVCKCILRGHTHVVQCVVFALCGSTKSISSSFGIPSTSQIVMSCGRDKNVILWNASEERILAKFDGHLNWVRQCIFHPLRPEYIITCGDDGVIRAFELSSQRCVKRIEDAHRPFALSIAFSARSALIASGGEDMLVKIWPTK